MTELDALLAQQAGVLTRAQALPSIGKHAWDWRLERGVWQRLLPGVAVTHSGGLSEEQRRWAAVLYAGKDAALAGRSALAALGMRFGRDPVGVQDIDVVVPLERRPLDAALPDKGRVRIHRLKDPMRWNTTRRGLPVVRAEASVLHAAAWAASERDAEWVLAAAVQQGRTTVPLVRGALAQMPELTRRALLREVLDDVELGAHAASELLFLRFLRAYGLPLPDELQLKVRVGATYYLDARYPRQRLTVEIDGAHHRDVERWDADALRTLRVVAHRPGEQLVRITTGLLRHHAAEVAELLGLLLVEAAA
jgi:hypothetical protein